MEKSPMKTETLNCLEITYTTQCPFEKNCTHKVQEGSTKSSGTTT